MHVEIVVEVCLHEVVHEASDRRAYIISMGSVLVLDDLVPHICRTELCLRLVSEDRLLDLDADRTYDSLTDILRSEVLLRIGLEELLEGL